MALFHRRYRVNSRVTGTWSEWTSINPHAVATDDNHPHDSEVLGEDHSEVFQNMIAGGWNRQANECLEFSITLVKTDEDIKW